MNTELQRVEVAIALLWHAGGLLINRRQIGQHLEGLWEFPGGKIEEGESPEAAAARELMEEVQVAATAVGRRARIQHRYPDRCVVLWPIDCRPVGKPPDALPGLARWVHPLDLPTYQFPAANRGLIAELIAAAG